MSNRIRFRTELSTKHHSRHDRRAYWLKSDGKQRWSVFMQGKGVSGEQHELPSKARAVDVLERWAFGDSA